MLTHRERDPGRNADETQQAADRHDRRPPRRASGAKNRSFIFASTLFADRTAKPESRGQAPETAIRQAAPGGWRPWGRGFPRRQLRRPPLPDRPGAGGLAGDVATRVCNGSLSTTKAAGSRHAVSCRLTAILPSIDASQRPLARPGRLRVADTTPRSRQSPLGAPLRRAEALTRTPRGPTFLPWNLRP